MIESFTFGLVDAEFILRRNFKTLKEELQNYDEVIDTSKLFGMFLNSIMKFKRDFSVKYVICAFDKSPYYHATAIENYKGDRYNAEEEKKSLEEQLKNPDLTEEQRQDLLNQLNTANFESNNFWKYQEVKKSLIENSMWSRAGFHTIYKRGYEADTLVYRLATKIHELHMKQPQYTALLYSSDKDYVNFQSEGVEFISAWNNINRYENLEETYRTFLKEYDETYPDAKVKLDMYSYGILNELAGCTHNNASVIKENDEGFNSCSWVEYYYRILNQEPKEGFISYDIVRKCYEAMNINIGKTCDNGYCTNIGVPYTEDIDPLIMQVLSQCDKYEQGVLAPLLEEHNISINIMNYSKYISNLNCVVNF